MVHPPHGMAPPAAPLAALLLLLLLVAATPRTARGQQDLVAQIDALAESVRAAYSMPGLGLAVVDGGSLLMTKGRM